MIRIAQSFERSFTTPLSVGEQDYQCWIASDDLSLRLGLMGYQLQPKQGCLLDFGKDCEFGLWMKDCLHPLTAVFADNNGLVVGTALMSHEDPYRSHRPVSACRYALELRPEDAEGIQVGDQLYRWVNDG